jgi:hypothetical protein
MGRVAQAAPIGEAAAAAEEALRRHSFVKLISGIGAGDALRVRNFAYLYTLAGAHAIDVNVAPANV